MFLKDEILSIIQRIESTTETDKIKPIEIMFSGSISNSTTPVAQTKL